VLIAKMPGYCIYSRFVDCCWPAAVDRGISHKLEFRRNIWSTYWCYTIISQIVWR